MIDIVDFDLKEEERQNLFTVSSFLRRCLSDITEKNCLRVAIDIDIDEENSRIL